MLQEAIKAIVQGENLSEDEARQAMDQVMGGQATPAQIGAFLVGLRLKGETVDEITGFARSMRERALPFSTRYHTFVDTCGTGGDGRGTFNISTMAALVVAACGLPVAKHGNRSVSSSCGSAEVLEALGVRVNLTPPEAAACLDQVGITFLFAPAFHLAMKHAAGPRKELGIRTVFNLLGPLTNPAAAPAQVLGVYEAILTEIVAEVLGKLGSRRALAVHGSDGMDEVTVTGPTKISELRDGQVVTYFISPEDLGLARWPAADLRGGLPEYNAGVLRAVLEGKPGAARDITLINAACALVAGEAAADLREGVAAAARAIDSGAALAKLEELVDFTRGCAA